MKRRIVMNEERIYDDVTVEESVAEETVAEEQVMIQDAVVAKKGFATAALVFGVLAFITTLFVINYVFGILALVFGIIYLAKKAEADGLAALKEAGADGAVLEIKKYEALVAMSNGRASKIIVPTDAVDMTKSNVIFSETSGLGDTTPPAPAPKKPTPNDPCCD